MYRYFEEELKEWKERDHKPLIVIGARQVGKTYSIEEFGRKAYHDLFVYNFQNDTAS